jgi:hypothetical protein
MPVILGQAMDDNPNLEATSTSHEEITTIQVNDAGPSGRAV